MSTGLLFAFGAMTAYVVLGLLHKQADRLGCRPQQITVLLFGWSAVISLVSMLFRGASLQIPGGVLAIAVPCGFCAAAAILLFQTGVRVGTIANSWLLINLSAAIPVLLSIVVFHERATVRQLLALGLMLACLIFFWLQRREAERKPS